MFGAVRGLLGLRGLRGLRGASAFAGAVLGLAVSAGVSGAASGAVSGAVSSAGAGTAGTAGTGARAGAAQATPARVSGVDLVGSGSGSGGVFVAGDDIEVRVRFNDPLVAAVGAPRVALGIGSRTRYAGWSANRGSGVLAFTYRVVVEDEDADGLSIGASALEANGGTISSNGVAADLSLSGYAITDGNAVVDGDGGPPRVTGVSLAGSGTGAGGAFIAGDAIEVRVSFDQPAAVIGTPQAALTVGTRTRQADYASGSGTTTLAFRYTVAASDADSDGVGVPAAALTLNGGAIRDADGNAALGLSGYEISGDPNFTVDGDGGAPRVAGVTLAGTGTGSGGAFVAGDALEVRVEFDQPATVSGTPQVEITVGTTARQADYASGSGTATLAFRYTVAASDADPDGVSVGASALTLAGGSIGDSEGAAALDLGSYAITDDSSFVVDGDGGVPKVVGVSLAGTGQGANGVFIAGDAVEVRVEFDQAAAVTGAPQVALGLGDGTRQAPYSSGSGTTTLAFRYTVAAGDSDADGISVSASALALNGGTIGDSDGAAEIDLSGHAITDDPAFVVDGGAADETAPTVTGATVTGAALSGSPSGAGGVFRAGDSLAVTVDFSEPVAVTGTPQAALAIGANTRQAAYASGSGTNALVFRYTVATGDADPNGVSVGASALALNGGTIRDTSAAAHNAALDLGNHAITDDPRFTVDGAAAPAGPTMTNIHVSNYDGQHSNAVAIAGNRIQISMSASQTVVVTGTPRVALGIGTATRYASFVTYAAPILYFQYRVQAEDEDANGISMGASALELNGGTIQTAGGVKANLSLSAYAFTDGPLMVDGDGAPPSVAGVTVSGAGRGPSGSFIAGDTLEVRVAFDQPVTVTGTPQVALTVGGATRHAAYSLGSGTTTLVFRYTVAAGDTDTDGVSVGASALTLNGGSIADEDGAASLGLGDHAIADDPALLVDGGAAAVSGPTVTGVSLSGQGNGGAGGAIFRAGDEITAAVEFNRAATVTGTPQLALAIGTATRQASYASGSGTTTLRFTYTVAAGDADADGISIGASALTLNGGTIADADGNAATAETLSLGSRAVTNDFRFRVQGSYQDLSGPRVTGVSLSGTGTGANGVFTAGDRITVTVDFHEAATVTGTPRAALAVGAATRQADYASGSGTASLAFRYTVAAGDADSDGVSVGASALALNGGTITDAAGNAASLGLGAHAIADDDDYTVDGGAADAAGPTVTGLTLSGSGSGTGGVLVAGDRLEASVTFSEAVTVTGTPQLALTIGAATKPADYSSGSGTTSLAFAYTVVTADDDANGISVAASALSLNGGTIADASGNAASLGLGSHAITDGDLAVDGDGSDTLAPTVTGLSLSGVANGAGGAFVPGDAIEATVTFSEAVTVTGTPQLALTVGSATRQADYASGSGTTELVFAYTVASGDTDTNGISVTASALAAPPGATVRDRAGNDAALALGGHALRDQGGYTVDGTAADTRSPTVVGVSLSGTGTADYGAFRAGDGIEVTARFDEIVTVTGTPQVALTVGAATKQADYASGSGTTSLVFRYTVAAADTDANGISVTASALALNGGTIADGAATPNDAALALGTHAITDHPDFKVDGSAGAAQPAVVGAALAGVKKNDRNNYIAGDVLEATITFSEPVTVTGTPRLALTGHEGNTRGTRHANYASGSGTASLVFRYRVEARDWFRNGLSVGASALALNGGTILDAAGNAAALDLGSHALARDGDFSLRGQNRDQVAPTVVGLTLSGAGTGAGGVFRAGDAIEAAVEFDEPVRVTGAPQLALTIGSATRQADYASGSGTATLAFRYTVASGDADANGIGVGASALALNGGTIKDFIGDGDWSQHATPNDAALGLGTHAIANDAAFTVNGAAADGAAPTITGVTLSGTGTGPGGVFVAGDEITVTVEFSEPVTKTGSGAAFVHLNHNTQLAELVSGSGTSSLVFRYTVLATDADADGISTGILQLWRGVTLRDAAGNDASLDPGSHAVANHPDFVLDGDGADATSPTVAGVTLSGSGRGANGVFIAGDEIEVTVTFTEAVTVTGTPQAALTVGADTRRADYASGSGTNALVFRYAVAAGDTDANGVGIGASALTLNGGTIADAAGNAAALGLGTHAITDGGPVVAGGATDTVVPTVTGAALSGAAPAPQGANGVFIAGDVLEATVSFSEPVTVTGTPRLALAVGTATRYASYASGSGTSALVFRYAVVAGDADANGVSAGASALSLAGGTIRDRANNNAALGLGAHAIADDSGATVNGAAADTAAPTITGLTISGTGSGPGGVFVNGDEILFTVEFSERITEHSVGGVPELVVSSLSPSTPAYMQGIRSGTSHLGFVLEVSRFHSAPSGVGASGIRIPGAGHIRDAAGNDAALDLGSHAITSDPDFVVRGGAEGPAVTGVTVGGVASGAGGVFIAGDDLEITVEFHEPATVTGTPRAALAVGRVLRYADYARGSGTSALVFRYTVAPEDRDPNGVSLGDSALRLNGGTVADASGNAAALGLGEHAVTDGGAAVDGSGTDAAAPTVTGLALSGSGQGEGGVFTAGDLVEAAVTFSERVTVTGAPRLALTVGTAARYADYALGSGTRTLRFRYRVARGDADDDGISVAASALDRSGGTIRDRANRDALPGLGAHAVTDDRRFRVEGGAEDTVAPRVTGLRLAGTGSAAGGVFTSGDRISITVEFSEPVTVTTGANLLVFLTGHTGTARRPSGSGTSSLTFRWTVPTPAPGDRILDADGIGFLANSLGVEAGPGRSAGPIVDAAGNAASLDLSAHLHHGFIVGAPRFRVDTAAADVRAPAVAGVTVSGTARGADGAFLAGDALVVTVDFSEEVTVTGAPRVALGIGSATRYATYASGSGTASLVFRYAVVRADADADGITLAASALRANGGRIADGSLAADLDLGEHAAAAGGAVVDGAGRAAASVTGVTLSAVGTAPQGANGVFISGDAIDAAVTFSEPVTVDATGGTPRLALTVGSAARPADYRSGSGSTTLTFRYTVARGDADPDGVAVAASALALNGGTITDRAGRNAALGLGARALPDDAAFRVDGSVDRIAPRVTGAALSGTGQGAAPSVNAPRAFIAGDEIALTVEFSEPVTVTGTPQAALTVGEAARRADYASGSGTSSLVFRYTVAAGDEDANGVSVAASALSRNGGTNGGTIADPAGNLAALDLGSHAIPDAAAFPVDGDGADRRPPTVTGLTAGGEPSGPARTSVPGDFLEFTVDFDEPVTVTGTPRLVLTVGAATRYANYRAAGSGPSSLLFRYTVAAGDTDANGVSVAADALELNRGTIRDAAGNAAERGLGAHAIADGDLAARPVDGSGSDTVAPTVTGVSLSAVGTAPQGANGVFIAGDAFEATVSFSEPVTVTGTPQLELAVGLLTRPAAYQSGSGTTRLVFAYAVAAGDSDPNGLGVPAAALTRNGGTIRDDAGNDAALGLGAHAVADAAGFPVDAAAGDRVGPTVVGARLAGNPDGGSGGREGVVFVAGNELEAVVVFSEEVTVTGTPQAAITVGAATRLADYAAGSGTDSLTFRYLVVRGDADPNGAGLPASALALNGGTIADASGNAAALGLGPHAVADHPDFPVDGAAADLQAPTVTGVTLSGTGQGAGGAFIAGDAIEAAVEFSERVTVTGTPRLALAVGVGVGAPTRQADYASGSGTRSLVFRYTVVSGDADADGVAVPASALALNGGSITDASGNAADLAGGATSRDGIADDGGFVVAGGGADAAAPTVTGVTVGGEAQGANGTFVLGDVLEVTVEFSEPVTVTGSPQVALTIGSAIRQAAYASGSGTTSLVFATPWPPATPTRTGSASARRRSPAGRSGTGRRLRTTRRAASAPTR